jgi:hypothetical protein
MGVEEIVPKCEISGTEVENSLDTRRTPGNWVASSRSEFVRRVPRRYGRVGPVVSVIITVSVILASVGFLTVTVPGLARAAGAAPFAIDGIGSAIVTSGNTVSTGLSTAYPDDVIVVFLVNDAFTPAASCSDTAGLSYHLRELSESAAPVSWFEFYAVSPSALSGDTISCFMAVGPPDGMLVFGVSGADYSSPFDPSSPTATTGSDSSPSVSLTTSYGLDMLVGLVGAAGSYTGLELPGTGFNAIEQPFPPPPGFGGEEQTVYGTGAHTITSSQPGSDRWTIVGDAIKASSLGECTPPSINKAPAVSVQSGYRQTWINWSWADSGTDPQTPLLAWNAVGGSSLPMPEPQIGVVHWANGGPSQSQNASINLNALSAGTTYDFTVEVENCGGTATDSGSFTTSAAPTSGFVGWVSAQSENVYLLDPTGSTLQGVLIDIFANCWGGQIAFGGFTTNSAGYYDVTGFPLQDGAYYLTSAGVCELSGYPSTSNPHYTLTASKGGYWNVTETISSTLSATNDYKPLVLPSNTLANIPVALSLIHTTYEGTQYYNAECGATFEASSSQSTIQQTAYSLNGNFFGFSGQTSTTEATAHGSEWSEPGSWGNTTGLQLGYYFSGWEWEGNETIANSYLVSSEQGANYNPATTTDWLPAPSPLPAAIPSGYQFEVVPSTYPRSNPVSYEVFGGGTYTSITSDQIDFSVPLQWDGVTASPSVGLSDSNTVTTQTGYTNTCSFAYVTDPSGHGGEPYFYWFNQDTGVASAIVHVWLEGWCNYDSNPNNPEPACP